MAGISFMLHDNDVSYFSVIVYIYLPLLRAIITDQAIIKYIRCIHDKPLND